MKTGGLEMNNLSLISDTAHKHDWNIIDKKHDSIKRTISSESETHITSKCECGAVKQEYNKINIQEGRASEVSSYW